MKISGFNFGCRSILGSKYVKISYIMKFSFIVALIICNSFSIFVASSDNLVINPNKTPKKIVDDVFPPVPEQRDVIPYPPHPGRDDDSLTLTEFYLHSTLLSDSDQSKYKIVLQNPITPQLGYYTSINEKYFPDFYLSDNYINDLLNDLERFCEVYVDPYQCFNVRNDFLDMKLDELLTTIPVNVDFDHYTKILTGFFNFLKYPFEVELVRIDPEKVKNPEDDKFDGTFIGNPKIETIFKDINPNSKKNEVNVNDKPNPELISIELPKDIQNSPKDIQNPPKAQSPLIENPNELKTTSTTEVPIVESNSGNNNKSKFSWFMDFWKKFIDYVRKSYYNMRFFGHRVKSEVNYLRNKKDASNPEKIKEIQDNVSSLNKYNAETLQKFYINSEDADLKDSLKLYDIPKDSDISNIESLDDYKLLESLFSDNQLLIDDKSSEVAKKYLPNYIEKDTTLSNGTFEKKFNSVPSLVNSLYTDYRNFIRKVNDPSNKISIGEYLQFSFFVINSLDSIYNEFVDSPEAISYTSQDPNSNGKTKRRHKYRLLIKSVFDDIVSGISPNPKDLLKIAKG